MNITKVSEISYYNKPTRYADGSIDKSGVHIRKVVCDLLKNNEVDQVLLIGDSEDDEFNFENWMEPLASLFDDGETLEKKTLSFRDNQGYVDVELCKTKVGMIVKVYSMSRWDIAQYFCVEDIKNDVVKEIYDVVLKM